MASNIYESSWEWTLTEITSFRDFQATPSFSLLPVVDLTLCFKYHYQEIIHPDNNQSDLSSFRLSLVKLRGSDVLDPVDFEVNVIVNYSNGSCYHKYKTKNCNARKIKEVIFKDIVSELYTPNLELSSHSENMESDSLVLKCCLKIKDDRSKNTVAEFLPNTFIKDFSSIYESAVLSDVKIEIGDKYLPAHKTILAAHSTVFLKMLTNDFKESRTSTITITDSDYNEFKTFLKYLYTAEIEDPSWTSIRQLYRLADKYDVSSLRRDCQRRMLSLMNEDNICDILMLIYDHEDKDIKEKVVDFAVSHIKSIINTEAWKSMIVSHVHIGFDITRKFVPE